MKKTRSSGFTLVELMIVIVIIGTLVAMVMPRLAGKTDQAKHAAAKADIEVNIASGFDLYEVDHGTFPESMEILLQKKDGKGPYLKKTAIDPWGHPYKYVFPGVHGDYDLYSYGKDGVDNSGEGDDISNWESGGERSQ